jgi:hypothetical protein
MATTASRMLTQVPSLQALDGDFIPPSFAVCGMCPNTLYPGSDYQAKSEGLGRNQGGGNEALCTHGAILL